MELTNCIPLNFYACNESILNAVKDERYATYNQECKEGLDNFIVEAGITKMNIYPNFHIGNILGPTGYVAEIPLGNMFSFYLFNQQLFRQISFFEISITSDFISSLKTDEKKDIIRKVIPLQTTNFPSLSDTPMDSWSPALGYYGSSIGIYSFEEMVGNEQSKRYFIGVHSGLHAQTVDILNEKFIGINYNNHTISNEGKTNNSEVPKINTYSMVFQDNEKSLTNMRKISIANNRRLAYIFAVSLGINFINNDIKYVNKDTKRLTMIDTKKDHAHTQSALQWWPKGVPMFFHSTIAYKWKEDDKNELIEKRIRPSETLQDMAIGELYKNLIDTADTDHRKEILKNLDINFIDKIYEAIPIAECDYNTYRLNQGHVYVYNGCCTTITDQRDYVYNVIRQMSMVQGYQIYNSTISRKDTIKNEEEHKKWSNKAGNGFITVPMLEKRPNNDIPVAVDKLNAFFSLYNDINPNRLSGPKQMKYIPRNGSTSEETAIKNSLHAQFTPNTIQLTPEFVYLSPDVSYNVLHNQ